jgi:hypothetical protein
MLCCCGALQVINPKWSEMFEVLRTASTVDDVIKAHSSFLDSCLQECLLTNHELVKVPPSVLLAEVLLLLVLVVVGSVSLGIVVLLMMIMIHLSLGCAAAHEADNAVPRLRLATVGAGSVRRQRWCSESSRGSSKGR